MEKFLALSEEKQTAVRNAALSCFAKHGYDKASINDIAIAAGISKASMFQYFGSKQALYQYLFHYCSAQMKQVYDTEALDANADFFDRVWTASVMKVENLRKHPYVAAFIASAATEQSPEVKKSLDALMNQGTEFIETLVLRTEDAQKFKRPQDAKLVFQMLMLLGKGLSFQIEREGETDYSGLMMECGGILQMLKRNFYKEEYCNGQSDYHFR